MTRCEHAAQIDRSMRRIAVIGTSCSGKTTLARRLAAELSCPHLELDAFHWGPNWTEKPPEQVRAAIDEQTRQPAWVSCGNYSFLRDIVWQRADTIVWLNYPFSLVAGRALRRTSARCGGKSCGMGIESRCSEPC
jgi:adenylate kinase family enzyme